MSDSHWVHVQRHFDSLTPCREGVSQPESGEKATKVRLSNLELHDLGARRDHSRMMPQRVREMTDLPKVTQHVGESQRMDLESLGLVPLGCKVSSPSLPGFKFLTFLSLPQPKRATWVSPSCPLTLNPWAWTAATSV